MSTTEAWTVGKLLVWTTDYLKKHGSQSPRLDAEVLLAHARGCQRIELYTAYAEEPTEQTKAAFRENVRRRSEGTPVAYLVGHKEFYSQDFQVNSDVLIPRPETEHLVVEALDRGKALREARAATEGRDAAEQVLNVVDVGTGSGVIALSVAKHLPNCRVTATDVSPTALAVARENAAQLGMGSEHVAFVECDLLSGLPALPPLDLILSNPPYVSEAEYAQLEPSVRNFEPRVALVAGPQGYEVIVQLLRQAHDRLADDGYVLFEFSPMLAARLEEFVGPQWEVVEVTKDLAGHARVVTLRKSQA